MKESPQKFYVIMFKSQNNLFGINCKYNMYIRVQMCFCDELCTVYSSGFSDANIYINIYILLIGVKLV